MGRKVIRIVSWCLAALIAMVTAVMAYSVWDWDRVVDAPYPPIEPDRSPAGVTRGAAIFHSTCEVCHRGAGSERASGAPITDPPAFLGTFHASNLTADRSAGVGAFADREIARMIRYGLNRQGKRSLMPTYAMGDADIAAVLGFMRSNDPLFLPDATIAPPSKPSVLGKTVMKLAGATRTPTLPPQGVPVPPKAATIEYGQYLAHAVYDCVGCHTPGFDADKATGPDRFAGGFEFRDPNGQPVVAPNLTFDETGIAHYQTKDLVSALRNGKRPDGTALSAPMPMFGGLEDVEVEALYAYLESVPHRRGATPPRARP